MKKRLMNNFGLKALAFLVAFLSWIVVVNIDDPVTSKTFSGIAVSVTNEEVLAKSTEPQTYQIVDGTEEISVTVTAKRKILSQIRSEDIIAVANMKELSLGTQIPIDITINGFEGSYVSAVSKPRNLQVKLEDELTKRFPIVPTTTGSVRDGYVLGDIEAIPEKVSISGPKTVINSINRVEASVDVSGLSRDSVLNAELVIYDADNNLIQQNRLSNNLGTEDVSVSVELLRSKKVSLEIDGSGVTADRGYAITGITYEPHTIQIAGSYGRVKNISKIIIPSYALNIHAIREKTEQTVDVSEYLPKGIRLVDENAGAIVVTASVEKDGTKSYDITVGSVIVNNLSKKFLMSYANADLLEVQVSGPKHSLDELELGQAVSIDLENYKTAGRYTVPVQVKLPEDCSLEKEISVEVILTENE